jgi:formiminotetrahydrofolate cyclodeaminase
MIYDKNQTLAQFLDAAAAKQPTPGGGSIAALCGALSAAMGEMVINYSIGKKDLAAYEAELRPALQTLHKARELMLGLMTEDQLAYTALAATRKLPAGPDRDIQFRSALLASIRTPEAIGATAVSVLKVCDQIINFVNFQLLSDLAVCADLAMATARCSIYNVRVNMADVTDPADRQRIESTVGQILSHAATLIQQISPRIWARHGQGA